MLDAAGVQKILDDFAALKALKGGGGGADAKKAANADKEGKIEARVRQCESHPLCLERSAGEEERRG